MFSLRHNGCTYKFAHPISYTRSFSFSSFFNFDIVSSIKNWKYRRVVAQRFDLFLFKKMLIENCEKYFAYWFGERTFLKMFTTNKSFICSLLIYLTCIKGYKTQQVCKDSCKTWAYQQTLLAKLPITF